ncbi:hypothetical protein F4827_003090 [Paraburkholderia bannensis]|uniref:Uncharacterized protein n=1 Tax=Paraburkholderia bannensis TaxID=765414 RepID=A0A7W9TZJ0_9BURK|nr:MULTISPECIES: hypothetical protein [Paraburkholderia]MBB3258222.1 hypothetical protein [Paraburkholderia sp. WP4_3_2]MBB6103235.1 hypothetical protein [Paraburkholderia bannensis]
MHAALGRDIDDPNPLRLDRIERMAMSMTFREFEGSEFDFNTMSWKSVDQP